MEVGKSLLDRLPVGVGIVDESGDVLFMNRHLQGLAGTSRPAGKCWQVYRDDKTQCRDCPLRSGISVNGIRTLESYGVFGGRTFQIGHFGIVLKGKKAMLEMFTDITERKKLEEQLHHARKMESLGTLAGGIAHDFNNILAIIKGHADLLNGPEQEPHTQAKSLDAIATATARGTALVQQLLRFARKTDVTLEPVSVNDSIRELVSLLHQTFPRAIDIVTDLDPDIPWVVADATELHQVLLNLCVNSRDAMPQGGRLTMLTRSVAGEEVRKQFPTASASRYVNVEISDTGLGMDEQVRQRIFEPFFSTKGIGKGTGLGLATAYGIVQSHSGFIDVRSEIGRGTTFRVFLPSERTMHKSVDTSAPIGESQGGNETILVVEDEEALREVAEIVLSSKGYTVLTAKDGAEAIDIYRDHGSSIKVVITDLGLPVLAGDQLARTLRHMNSSLDLIIASGYIDAETKSELSRAGVKEFVQKPYQQEELLRAIRRVLDSHEASTLVEPLQITEDPLETPADAGAVTQTSEGESSSPAHPGPQGILLAVRDTLVQSGLRHILQSLPDFQIDAEVLSVDDLKHTIADFPGRVLVLDEAFYGELTGEAQTSAKEGYPDIHTMLLSTNADSPTCFRAAEQGLSCFITTGSEGDLVRALQDTAAGRQYVSDTTFVTKAKDGAIPRAKPSDEILSERERAILRLIVLGKSAKEISGDLEISVKTVSMHRTRILKKLGLKSTASLIAYTHRHRVVR